jgi:hypothetical protein
MPLESIEESLQRESGKRGPYRQYYDVQKHIIKCLACVVSPAGRWGNYSVVPDHRKDEDRVLQRDIIARRWAIRRGVNSVIDHLKARHKEIVLEKVTYALRCTHVKIVMKKLMAFERCLHKYESKTKWLCWCCSVRTGRISVMKMRIRDPTGRLMAWCQMMDRVTQMGIMVLL